MARAEPLLSLKGWIKTKSKEDDNFYVLISFKRKAYEY